MPIDNQTLLAFCNQTVRPAADRLAGLLPVPLAVLDAAVGQGLPAVLGTTASALLRAEPWTDADYAAIPQHEIVGSGSDGRAVLTNWDLIGILRVLSALKTMMAANEALGPLVGKVAVNPRA